VANAFYEAGIDYHKNTQRFYYDDGEYFIPDFIVNRDVVIEYFGLIREGCKESWSIIKNYRQRHKRKLKYFQMRPEIKFVALYPIDLERIIERVMEVTC